MPTRANWWPAGAANQHVSPLACSFVAAVDRCLSGKTLAMRVAFRYNRAFLPGKSVFVESARRKKGRALYHEPIPPQ
jgi:hypothetical protein